MKTLSIAFFVFGLFNIAQAQFASVDYGHNGFPSDPHEQPANEVAEVDNKAELYADHSQIAVRSLTEHLARETDYPAALTTLGMEKTIKVLVEIDDRGGISKWTYKGKSDSVFQRQIDIALAHFGKLPIDGTTYAGGKSLLIPVQFSIR